jgi:hypothetical protein
MVPLMAGTFRERLADVAATRINATIENERNTLAAGNLPDHATYRYHCGRIKGLEIALDVIDEVLTELQKG